MKTLQEVKAAYLNEALSSPVGGYVVMDRNGKVAAHSNSGFVHCFVDPLDLEAARAAGYECKDEEIDGRVLTWVNSSALLTVATTPPLLCLRTTMLLSLSDMQPKFGLSAMPASLTRTATSN